MLESVLEVPGVQGLEVDLIILLLLLLHEQPIEIYLIVYGLYAHVDDLLVEGYDAGDGPPPWVDLNTASQLELVIKLEDKHLLLAGDVEQLFMVGEEFDYPTCKRGKPYIRGLA